MENSPLITNDAVVLGLLTVTIAVVFATSASKHPGYQKFYRYVPTVLLCYFIPSLFNTFNVIDGESSNLYFVASRYLLPASLVLFTLSIDFKEIRKLGGKALIMFLAGTIGVIIGGPLAILIVGSVKPDLFSEVELWRGMSTIAGSWIGGGANQTAMFVVWEPPMELFTQMIAVDIIIANIWLGFLLYWSKDPERMDKLLNADASKISRVQKNIEAYQLSIMRIPSFADTMKILGIGLGLTGLAHFMADGIAPWIGENYPQLKELSLDSAFFWIVVIATTGGLLLSFTRYRELEGAGASRLGSAFLYILVATIGMQMNLSDVLNNPGYFVIGLVWISVHIIFLMFVAWLIKSPFFFVAVGSQANIGGAASAPIVAASFNPSLAPVGVLLAVLGYAVGTYGAYICAVLMQWVSEGLFL
jgi:uncharacterized membrane protein